MAINLAQHPQPDDSLSASLLEDNQFSCRCSQLHYLLALKFFPIGVAEALKGLGDTDLVTPSQGAVREQTPWSLLNWDRSEVHELKQAIANHPDKAFRTALEAQLRHECVEHVGLTRFFAKHWTIKQPIVLVSSCIYSYWLQAVKSIGLGESQVLSVDVNRHMQIDDSALNKALANGLSQNVPVLSIITPFIDPITGNIDHYDTMLHARQNWRHKGLNYFFQIDSEFAEDFAPYIRQGDPKFGDTTKKNMVALQQKAASLVFTPNKHTGEHLTDAKDTQALCSTLGNSLQRLFEDDSLPASGVLLNEIYSNRVALLFNPKSNHSIKGQSQFMESLVERLGNDLNDALTTTLKALPEHWFVENELNQIELSLGIDPNEPESGKSAGVTAMIIHCDGREGDEWFGRKAVRSFIAQLRDAIEAAC